VQLRDMLARTGGRWRRARLLNWHKFVDEVSGDMLPRMRRIRIAWRWQYVPWIGEERARSVHERSREVRGGEGRVGSIGAVASRGVEGGSHYIAFFMSFVVPLRPTLFLTLVEGSGALGKL
jgi:hypothetical protein